MEYDNTNRGALFVNERKESDSHPDRTGKINVNGKDYRLAGWIKETSKSTMLSLSVSEFQEKPCDKPAASKEEQDSIPF